MLTPRESAGSGQAGRTKDFVSGLCFFVCCPSKNSSSTTHLLRNGRQHLGSTLLLALLLFTGSSKALHHCAHGRCWGPISQRASGVSIGQSPRRQRDPWWGWQRRCRRWRGRSQTEAFHRDGACEGAGARVLWEVGGDAFAVAYRGKGAVVAAATAAPATAVAVAVAVPRNDALAVDMAATCVAVGWELHLDLVQDRVQHAALGALHASVDSFICRRVSRLEESTVE